MDPCTTLDMGCTRSRHEPLICESDEEEFMARNSQRCGHDDRGVGSSQSSADYSIFKVSSSDTRTMGAGSSYSSCPSHWWGSVPSLIGLVLLAIFLLTVFRRWQNKQRKKEFRRQMQESLALQTVSSGVVTGTPGATAICGPDSQWRGLGGRFLS